MGRIYGNWMSSGMEMDDEVDGGWRSSYRDKFAR